MSSTERESSRDSDRFLRHQHSSSSDHGRAMIPMWDSSDPERAPPPLPLNPSSPVVNTSSRVNTSTAIQSAHAALTERARNFIHAATDTPKHIDTSPDRSLVREATHKRLQSVQTGHVRGLSSSIEGGTLLSSPKSPEKHQDRQSNSQFTPQSLALLEPKSPEKDCLTSSIPTAGAQDTPNLRPSLRKPPQSILGENTPPQSATMMALRSISTTDMDSPFTNTTSGSNVLVRTPQTFDAISNQILSLTSIATSLQREMAQLSRRSKDNATDLLSLKEATNARDEDIRKSLRELVGRLTDSTSRPRPEPLFIDNKPHTPSSKVTKTFSLPRIPSPTSYSASLDRGSAITPVPYHVESAATMALLEKILRDMGTKEGQEMVVSRLLEAADRLSREGLSTSTKIDELLRNLKESSDSRALVPQAPGGSIAPNTRTFSFGDAPNLTLNFEQPRSGPMVSRVEHLLGSGNTKENRQTLGTNRAAELINEDILKIIQSVKDSVSQGGGLTAEVKALVRELRGEVLGMGREIGKRLEQNSREESVNSKSADKAYITRIVQDGLEELKQHMDTTIHEARRQSVSSAVSRSTVDSQEIYNAVKNAIIEMEASRRPSRDLQSPNLAKEDIINAVRDAWENSKPEIEFQHFGLERDELLACLKEGIQECMPQDTSREMGATREEVFQAVVEAMKHFSPPRIESEASLSRDEILEAVRESLEDFDFPTAETRTSTGNNITKDDMVEAVREGLRSFDYPGQSGGLTRDIDSGVDQGNLFSAVKAGLESLPVPIHGGNQEVMNILHDIVDTMRTEFKAVSDEAKQNVAANGRDTEQVLDATKDGFEKLRADIESYVDRAAVGSGGNTVIESLKRELDNFREAMASSVIPPGATTIDRDDILSAFRDGLDGLRVDLDRPRASNESILSGTGEILDALHDGLAGLRTEVEKIGSKPVDMTVNYEILDTLKAGLEGVRADIDKLRDNHQSEREVASVTNGAVVTAESLKRNDIENLEVLITQLRIKVEALESMPSPPSETIGGSISKEDISGVEEMLRNVQASVEELSNREQLSDEANVRKEDVEAIETLLRNTKGKLEDMDADQAVKKIHLEMVEELIRETRNSVNDLTEQFAETSRRDDVIAVDALVKDVLVGLEEMKDRALREAEDLDKVTRTDVEAVETLCFDIKSQIEQMISEDISPLASKSDITSLTDIVKEVKDKADYYADANAKAFEERQAETVGVGERVTEIKTLLQEFKDAIKEKMLDDASGIEEMRKLLEHLGETISQNSTMTGDINGLSETIKSEFEKSNAGVVGVKLDSDDKFQKTWGKLDEKFAELLLRYEDAQTAAEIKSKEGEIKVTQAETAMLSTKAVAEELKILVDALGSTLTESVDRMDEVSKTVFNRVEETFTRLEETHADSKTEHHLTREQVFKTLDAVEGIQGNIQEYHPKLFESIKDVLLIVGQHYEHSKTTADAFQEKISERANPPLPTDQPLLRETPMADKYDDVRIHEKLDKLMDQMHSAGKAFAQIDMLDQIHQRVMQTAAEVSEFVSIQTQRITNDHEDREKAAADAAIALEKQVAQKQGVEGELLKLRDQELQLKSSIAALKSEQTGLAQHKMRLAADVSSLETALRIRREELHAMEARAESLERRILEGVIDHSRAFLISKTNAGRDAMNLRRIPSQTTSANGSALNQMSSRSRASFTAQSGVDIAMDGSRTVFNQPMANPAGSSRRILSLSQINHNVPAGTFKRSHSVKDPNGSGSLRKSSWGGSLTRKEYGDLNKENLALKEGEEGSEDDDALSDAETLRRTSRATTVLTGSEVTESIEEGSEYSGTEDYADSVLERSMHDQGYMVSYEEV